ncbi:unnamed protein product [Prunus armeniaca]|uniref:Uncharacterized protein n=1 Tax=Prunus armeniaca TaxID=36596 RepID=A0A6J5XI56_PRUAR|nr:unnamed protein product [Prunus armeniaca]
MQAKPSHAEESAPYEEGFLERNWEKYLEANEGEVEVGSSEKPLGEDGPDPERCKGRGKSQQQPLRAKRNTTRKPGRVGEVGDLHKGKNQAGFEEVEEEVDGITSKLRDMVTGELRNVWDRRRQVEKSKMPRGPEFTEEEILLPQT